MSEQLTDWQRYELHCQLIPRLVALEKPESEREAKLLRRQWRDAGYEAVVSAWTYCHRKQRRQEV